MSKLSVLLMCFISMSFYAQDSLQNKNFKKHLTLGDTFFGNEELHQVCYPKDHRSMFYFIIIFSITSLILGLMIIYIKHSVHKKLRDKNTIITEQNKDLIDSINYAQKIQLAILPDEETQNKVLDNGFVLYKPKHIVSGDFYWLHQIDDVVFIALMDCTGHGVPGALLTMLGYNAINKAVIEKGLSDPTFILDSMNDDVKTALKQHENNNTVQDSMEVAFICFNKSTYQLAFSGANLSLTYIHENQLKIINGGKCAVGSVQQRGVVLPKTHVVKLVKGDCFYIYSDGYADQFGGEKGKKYKYKQLEELLKLNASKTPFQQKKELNSSFESWKGKLEQVDDVTVIGFKIS